MRPADNQDRCMAKIPKRTPLPVLWMWRWRRSEVEDSRFQTPQQRGNIVIVCQRRRVSVEIRRLRTAFRLRLSGMSCRHFLREWQNIHRKIWEGPTIFPESMCISDAERFFQSRESAWTTHRESLRAKS